jgi:hypothetical protein
VADVTDAKPAAKPKTPRRPEPTHVLHLSDGSTRDSYGAIPTHYTEGDKVLRVVAVDER